jgi:hypothetical protein
VRHIIPLYRITLNDSPIASGVAIPLPVAEHVSDMLQRADKQRVYDVAFAEYGPAPEAVIGAYASALIEQLDDYLVTLAPAA